VRGAITLILAIVLFAVIAMDGYGMFVAFQTSKEIALGAAQSAALNVQATGNEGAAQKAANEYVTKNGGELLELERGRYQSHWYRAKVRVEPDTRVFHFIPLLNRLLDQESTASYTF